MPQEPWTHREEAVGGLRLHWVEAGEGPLVLLLHGFPEHWLAWRHQIPALAAAGFRVVAPDLRGYNLSGEADGRLAATGWSSSPETSRTSSGTWATRGRTSSATTGAARSPGASRRSTPVSSRRLAILNAPHPILFRKKLATLAQAKRSSYVFFFQLPFFPERSLLRHRAGFLKMMLRRDPVTPGAFSPDEIEAYREAFLVPARRRRRSTTTARPSAPARGFRASAVPSTASRRSSSGARETATSAPSSSTASKPSSPTSASSGSRRPATGFPPTRWNE